MISRDLTKPIAGGEADPFDRTLLLKTKKFLLLMGRNPASQLLGSFAQLFAELFPKKQDRNSNHQKSRKQCKSLQVNLFKGKPLW